MNYKFLAVTLLLAGTATVSLRAQTAVPKHQSYLRRNLVHRVYLGYYSSYSHDDIRLAQVGYEAALKLLNLRPDYNLLQFGFGLNALFGFDWVNEPEKDGFGHLRPDQARNSE